jgi:hypothetical protein
MPNRLLLYVPNITARPYQLKRGALVLGATFEKLNWGSKGGPGSVLPSN